MKQVAGLVIPIMIFSTSINGQKHTQHIQQVWIGYFNQVRFSDKWSSWVDVHLRTKEVFFTNFSTGIVRLGLTYHASEQLKLTAGYAFANYFPADNHSGISQPEHRPWQQVQYITHTKKSRWLQALRLEERYRRKILDADELGEGYNFNFRLRYNLMVMLPLSKRAFAPNTLSFSSNDEIQINFGKEIFYNYFDQNRFFIGLAYHVSPNGYLQFGYMSIFQQLAAGNRYKSLHVARINYYHTFDLRKNKNNLN